MAQRIGFVLLSRDGTPGSSILPVELFEGLGGLELLVRKGTLGRSQDCDITIAEAAVSSCHCKFWVSQGDEKSATTVSIADQSSTNGTAIRLRTNRLTPNIAQTMRIGDVLYLAPGFKQERQLRLVSIVDFVMFETGPNDYPSGFNPNNLPHAEDD